MVKPAHGTTYRNFRDLSLFDQGLRISLYQTATEKTYLDFDRGYLIYQMQIGYLLIPIVVEMVLFPIGYLAEMIK